MLASCRCWRRTAGINLAMKRRTLLLGSVATLAMFPISAQAAAVDDIVAQLAAQGFADIEVTSTMLGRVRILARRNGRLRELIVNPRTGEVLRDVWISDRDDDDDHDEDDDRDDDEDDSDDDDDDDDDD